MKIVTKDEPLQMTQVVVGIYGDPGKNIGRVLN